MHNMYVSTFLCLYIVEGGAQIWKGGAGQPARSRLGGAPEYLNDFSGGASAGTRGCMQHLLEWPRWSEETVERIEDDIARGGHGDSASAPAQGSAGAGMRRHGHVDVL